MVSFNRVYFVRVSPEFRLPPWPEGKTNKLGMHSHPPSPVTSSRLVQPYADAPESELIGPRGLGLTS